MLEIPPMATWVTDLQHLVPEFVKDAPAPAKRRAAFTREVVEAATCRDWKEPWISLRCTAWLESAGDCVGAAFVS